MAAALGGVRYRPAESASDLAAACGLCSGLTWGDALGRLFGGQCLSLAALDLRGRCECGVAGVFAFHRRLSTLLPGLGRVAELLCQTEPGRSDGGEVYLVPAAHGVGKSAAAARHHKGGGGNPKLLGDVAADSVAGSGGRCRI